MGGAPGKTEHAFAKATYVKTRGVWKVYWMRGNLEWHPYEPARVRSFEAFLQLVNFRGFAFRHLRTGRSFWHAAGLSALLFSSVHLAHLIEGVSPEILTNMTISILFSSFMGFSLACLYEYGGNSLWGCALLHVTIDSGNWFSNSPDAGLNAPYLIMMLGLAASLILVFPLVSRDKALYE